MEKKKKSNYLVWILIVLVIFIIAAYLFFTLSKDDKEDKPMQDYTWQQVAYIGVLLLGLGWVLKVVLPYKVKYVEIRKIIEDRTRR